MLLSNLGNIGLWPQDSFSIFYKIMVMKNFENFEFKPFRRLCFAFPETAKKIIFELFSIFFLSGQDSFKTISQSGTFEQLWI